MRAKWKRDEDERNRAAGEDERTEEKSQNHKGREEERVAEAEAEWKGKERKSSRGAPRDGITRSEIRCEIRCINFEASKECRGEPIRPSSKSNPRPNCTTLTHVSFFCYCFGCRVTGAGG